MQVIVVDADKGREEMEEEFLRQEAIILGGDKENQGARGATAVKRVVVGEGGRAVKREVEGGRAVKRVVEEEGREVKRMVEEEVGKTRQPLRLARDN